MTVPEEHLVALEKKGIISFDPLEASQVKDFQSLLNCIAFEESQNIHGLWIRSIKKGMLAEKLKEIFKRSSLKYPDVDFEKCVIYNIKAGVTISIDQNCKDFYELSMHSCISGKLTCRYKNPTQEICLQPGDAALCGTKHLHYMLKAEEDTLIIRYNLLS